MGTRTTSIRRACPGDVPTLSLVSDAAWREAYRGIIPGVALERILAGRDAGWWRASLDRGRPVAVIDIGETVIGYGSYGRARGRALGAPAEIDEIYLLPEYQGVGLGRRLFRAIRNDLRDRGLPRFGVWCLEDNRRACDFYAALGGTAGPRVLDRMAGIALPKVGYLFG